MSYKIALDGKLWKCGKIIIIIVNDDIPMLLTFMVKDWYMMEGERR